MPRHLVLGNGNLLINLDDRLNVRDLYYPYVGMLNHVNGNRNSIGVWVDGRFAWTDEEGWQRDNGYLPDTLVTDIRATHPGMGVELTVNSAVHFHYNLYLARIRVKNLDDRARELRVFFTHDFAIDQTDIGDTAFYDINLDAVMHYKRSRSFLISGSTPRGGIYQYATGTKRFGGAEGTWRDAEDGWLEGNPIAQGSVDSTISFRLDLGAREEQELLYWMAVGDSFEAVWQLAATARGKGVKNLLSESKAYWRSWIGKQRRDFKDLSQEAVDLFHRSLLTVRTQIDNRGAILAANDTDILQYNRDHYSYMWPRDGALVALAMDKAGYTELTRDFFLFCKNALSPSGFLWHKYNPDGSVGSSWHPWVRHNRSQLPIQEDETALVIHALWNHYQHTQDLEFVRALYEPLILKAAEFMIEYREKETLLPMESYDLWEERRGVFTYTAATVYAGLRAAARFARLFGHKDAYKRYRLASREVKQAMTKLLFDTDLNRFHRGYYRRANGELVQDPTLESSLWSLFALDVFRPDDPKVEATMQALEAGLWIKTHVGGMPRYYQDYYFHKTSDFSQVPGNPWVICTLWLAQWYIAKARSIPELSRARELIEWVCQHRMSSGLLSEQIHPYTGQPVSVSPLTWSHATFVDAIVDYLEKVEDLEQRKLTALAWQKAGE